MLKKASRMSLFVVRIAVLQERTASNKTGKCMKLHVLIAERWTKFRSCQKMTDLFIAVSALKSTRTNLSLWDYAFLKDTDLVSFF